MGNYHNGDVFKVTGEEAAGEANDCPRFVINGTFEHKVDAFVECSAVHRVAYVNISILQVTYSSKI